MDHASILRRTDTPRGSGRQVRLGLVIDAWEQPRWISDALREAVTTGVMTVGAVLLTRTSTGPNRGAPASRPQPIPPLLERLYRAADRARFHPDEGLFAPTSLRPLAAEARTVPLHIGDASSPPTIAAPSPLEEGPLDVILNLSGHVETSALAGLAACGAVAFALGETDQQGGGAFGLGEVLRGDPVIRVRLQRWPGMGRPPNTAVATVTNTHPFSVGRTRDIAARHATTLLARLGRSLANEMDDAEAGTALDAPDTNVERPAARPPRTPLALLRLTGRYARYLLRGRATRDQWVLAYHRGAEGGATPSLPERDPSRYREIVPSRDRFWADPFPVRVDGRDFLLFEELLFAEGIGHLSVIEVGPDGPVGEPTTVLQRPFHLSYPFTFEYGGELYLLPEMALEGRLELYRAVRAPFEWVLDRVILQGAMLLDATLAEIDGRWWMFACEYREELKPWTDLLLFHADSPFGPWIPHPRNPVVSDVRSARPAGRLFRDGGMWIRPAQDCSRTYGGAITLRRITTLTTTDYHEEPVGHVAADSPPGTSGPHTLNVHRGLSALDLKRRIRR